MENQHLFTDLIPHCLRSVPYIQQSHVFKAYCALENLRELCTRLPEEVWEHCIGIIREDEPKVKGLIAPELLELEGIVDPTSGRDFGPAPSGLGPGTGSKASVSSGPPKE